MRALLLLGMALIDCGTTPSRTAFEGKPTGPWTGFDVSIADRDPRELLVSFQTSARAHGCETARIGQNSVGLPGGGRAYVSSGVAAYCDEGSIALVWVADTRMRVGCQRPATHADCELLLRKISGAP